MAHEGDSRWSWSPAGDRALVIRWGGDADERAADAVRGLAEALMARRRPGLEEAVPGYGSVVVYYNPLVLLWRDLVREVEFCARAAAAIPPPPGRMITVPVLYGAGLGPDLEDVARLAGLDPDEVIAIHSGCEYRVYFLGFVPGFAYMGRVPERLRVPRLPRPRRAVPAGSVAIAGPQTGVYPAETPGGWRIIGRTPLVVYDPRGQPRALFRAGDRVRFRAVDRQEYEEIARLVARGAYRPEVSGPGGCGDSGGGNGA